MRGGAEPVTGMKLYNAGSFFDPRAVPEADYDAMAAALAGLSRIIVESHPALVGPRVDRLARRARPPSRTRSAVGAARSGHGTRDRAPRSAGSPEQAASRWRGSRTPPGRCDDRGVALRVFLLISPPFVPAREQDAWLLRSVDAAFSCGASVVSLMPTRPGNGAMEALARRGLFRAPRLDDIERSLALALAHARGRGRVFADVWDLERFARAPACFAARRARLQAMNLEQRCCAQPSCDALRRTAVAA